MITVHADVIVCGGGVSGFPAALSSAREGMSVVLIEEDAEIGGAVTDYGIRFCCGNPMHGIHLELINELKKIDPDYNNFNCFKASSYRLVWDKFMDGLPITILCNSAVKAVEIEKNRRL